MEGLNERVVELREQLVQLVGEDDLVDGLQVLSIVLHILLPIDFLDSVDLLMLLLILALILLKS